MRSRCALSLGRAGGSSVKDCGWSTWIICPGCCPVLNKTWRCRRGAWGSRHSGDTAAVMATTGTGGPSGSDENLKPVLTDSSQNYSDSSAGLYQTQSSWTLHPTHSSCNVYVHCSASWAHFQYRDRNGGSCSSHMMMTSWPEERTDVSTRAQRWRTKPSARLDSLALAL